MKWQRQRRQVAGRRRRPLQRLAPGAPLSVSMPCRQPLNPCRPPIFATSSLPGLQCSGGWCARGCTPQQHEPAPSRASSPAVARLMRLPGCICPPVLQVIGIPQDRLAANVLQLLCRDALDGAWNRGAGRACVSARPALLASAALPQLPGCRSSSLWPGSDWIEERTPVPPRRHCSSHLACPRA